MSSAASQKFADAGWVGGLIVWYLSHIAQINSFLQHIILLLTVVSLVAAIRYHWKNTK